jgi:NAD-dependent DNA ligase
VSSRTTTAAARASELREVLNRALIAYHVEDAPVMEDAAYDALFDELLALEDEHPELVAADSPTQRVGAPASERFRKVQHLSPMGSLDKVTTERRASGRTTWRPGGPEPSPMSSSRRSTASRST